MSNAFIPLAAVVVIALFLAAIAFGRIVDEDDPFRARRRDREEDQ